MVIASTGRAELRGLEVLMLNQETHNCHFVSRFLTKPWEGKERFLWFYDFDRDDFERCSSRSFFADEKLNTDAVEFWLKSSFEDVGRTVILGLESSGAELVPRDDVRFRPLWLLFALQGVRSTSLQSLASREQLERLAAASSEELDGVLAPLKDALDLRVVRVGGADLVGGTICVPSQGGFPVILRDCGCASGRVFTFGLPLDQRSVLLATPREMGGRVDVGALKLSVAASSVGSRNSPRVVVPPAALELHRGGLRDRLREDRAQNDREVAIANEQRELAVLTFKAMGLHVDFDTIGRITVPRMLDEPPTIAACRVEIRGRIDISTTADVDQDPVKGAFE